MMISVSAICWKFGESIFIIPELVWDVFTFYIGKYHEASMTKGKDLLFLKDNIC